VVARVLFGALLYGRLAVPTVAPFGPFVSKNHFAGYVEMAALVALGLALGLAERGGGTGVLDWVRSERAWQPLLAFSGFAVIALGLLVSLSRGGVVGLLAGLVIFFVLRLRIGHRAPDLKAALPMVAAGAVLVALLALLPGETHERIGTLATLQNEESAPFRVRVWRDALGAVKGSPIVGWGAGAFADAFPRVKSGFGLLRIEHAENEYVEALVETGVVGAGLIVAAIALGFRCALREYRQRKHRLFRRLGPGALAAVGALLVHGLFDFNLHIPSNAALFATVAALAAGAGHPALTRFRRGASFALAAAAAVLLASTLRPMPPAPTAYADAMHAAASPDVTARRLRMARAEEGERKLLARHPADPAAWLLLAWIRGVQGKPAEAAELARHAVELDPQNPDVAAQAAPMIDAAGRARRP
jgi:O-antigen ligase